MTPAVPQLCMQLIFFVANKYLMTGIFTPWGLPHSGGSKFFARSTSPPPPYFSTFTLLIMSMPKPKPVPYKATSADPDRAEEESVHQVYQAIAPHFAQTRHKVSLLSHSFLSSHCLIRISILAVACSHSIHQLASLSFIWSRFGSWERQVPRRRQYSRTHHALS